MRVEFSLFFFVLIVFCTYSAFAESISFVSAELQKDSVKVIGRARGLITEKEILQEKAIASALENPADILIERNFFYEEDGDSLFVMVTGFPARYTNVVALPIYEISAISAVVPTSNENLAVLQQEAREPLSGMYISLKAQTSIPWSSIGGNFQLGYFVKNRFFGIDFGIGRGDGDEYAYLDRQVLDENNPIFYSGAFSFGSRVGTSDILNVVLGVNLGAYSRLNLKETDSLIQHNGSNYYYIREREMVFGGGPFVKFLLRPVPRGRFWFEVATRLVLGLPQRNFDMYSAYNIKAGITYAPPRFSAVKR
ncbi:MAG: hypothetical protein FWE23_04090 [Chitinivibrionia bacterium]|nr:hypothetical protein [Chitinivibrionia bacterium]